MLQAALLTTLALALQGVEPAINLTSTVLAAVPTRPESTFFELENTAGETVGVAAYRTLLRPGTALFEREITFKEGGLVVVHTEEVRADRRRVIHREFRPGAARTWMARWAPGEGVRSVAYGWRRPVHEVLAAPVAARDDNAPIGLLELQHRVLTGERVPCGRVQLIDALCSRVIDVDISVHPEAGVTLVRPDGSRFASFDLGAPSANGRASSLAGVGVSGSLFGKRRLDAQSYTELVSRWRVDPTPAHEMALAGIRRAGPNPKTGRSDGARRPASRIAPESRK